MADPVTKRVILLERTANKVWQYIFWANVPDTRWAFYKKDPLWKSRYVNATPTELTALRNGEVEEQHGEISFDGTPQEVRAALQADWGEFSTRIQNYNPWLRYGTFWDGTAWTNQGVE